MSRFVTDTGPLTGIAAIDSKTLAAVSSIEDLIVRSTDGGHSWKPIDHPSIPDLFGAVRFVPGTKSGWAVGRGGKILHTTNGGKDEYDEWWLELIHGLPPSAGR